GVVEAGLAGGAAAADGFGILDLCGPAAGATEEEEQLGVFALAGGERAPVGGAGHAAPPTLATVWAPVRSRIGWSAKCSGRTHQSAPQPARTRPTATRP